MRSAESDFAAPSRVPGSSHDASSGRVHLSAKLTDRLENLARWRLSPSLFEFPEGGPEFHGGHATVSRALLCHSRESEEGMDEVDNAEAVAVKKIKLSGDLTRVLGLTLREAEFLVDLKHKNIIKLVGFVEEASKDMIWLVFPWEDNGNLKAFIASADWEIPERIWLINDVARGVKYLHSRQPPICHGDLKSINILVNSEYRAVITDFGSARRLVTNDLKVAGEQTENNLQPTVSSPEATFCAATNTITLTGDSYTLRWAAPELLQEEDSGTACDIWALGWVGYEVMTSFIPFQDVKDAVVIQRVVRGDLPSISNDVRMLLMQALCSLMIKCWSIDPSKRPTAEDCRKSMRWMNDYPKARKYFTEALDIYIDIVNREGEAKALFQLARIHRIQGEHDQAIPLYTRALEIYTDIGHRGGRARILWNLAEIHRHRDEYDDAITLCTEALQIWTTIGNRGGRADALGGLAEVYRLQGEYSQAVTFFSEELHIRTEIGDRLGSAEALWGLAEVYRLQKEYSQAIRFFSEALETFTGIGNRYGKGSALKGLANVHRDQDHYSDAIHYYEQAAEMFEQIGQTTDAARASTKAANVHRLLKERREAA